MAMTLIFRRIKDGNSRIIVGFEILNDLTDILFSYFFFIFGKI